MSIKKAGAGWVLPAITDARDSAEETVSAISYLLEIGLVGKRYTPQPTCLSY